MATNKNFQDGPGGEVSPKPGIVRVCPSCGKTAHLDRKYCDCHADLRNAGATYSAKLPEVGPCNFEAPGLHCGDCPEREGCRYCASFGEPRLNKDGFGGEECRHRTAGSKRCSCCLWQVKLALQIRRADFSGTFKAQSRDADNRLERAPNLFFHAASKIYDDMTRQVLARIEQAQERPF
jgi:hypothetical protein